MYNESPIKSGELKRKRPVTAGTLRVIGGFQKRVSVDMISNGRFELGVGYGWCVEEMRNHGVVFNKRRDLLREKVLLMKELWTQDEASYQG